MLTDTQKLELRSELFRGYVFPLVNRARQDRNPAYLDMCAFLISELRKFHGLPDDKHARFFIDYPAGPFSPTFTMGPWHEGGEDYFQEVGSAILHPEPLHPESAAAPASALLGGIFKRSRKPHAAAVVVSLPDGKSLQAHDND